MLRVLGISGSLREDSFNTGLLRAFAGHLGEDVEWTLLSPAILKRIPSFDEDEEVELSAQCSSLQELRRLIGESDVVVFATPEYNSSIPGFLKNAIDWLSRPVATNPLRNKPVAVLSATQSQFGGMWANEELRKVAKALGARVLDEQVVLPSADTQFGPDGQLKSQGMHRKLAKLAQQVIQESVLSRQDQLLKT